MRSNSTQLGRRRRPPTIAGQRRHWDAKNLVAARVITSSPEQHTPLQRDWARRFLARRAEEAKQ